MMNITKVKWIVLTVLFGFLFAVASANYSPTLADDSEGIAWRSKFVPCKIEVCGGFYQNAGTFSLKSSSVVVQSNGLVKIKLRRLVSMQTNAVLANKTLDVFVGSFTQGVFQSYQGPAVSPLYGTITTDEMGNFEGTIKTGNGTPFAFPSGSVVSAQFALNDPGVATVFITGFQIP